MSNNLEFSQAELALLHLLLPQDLNDDCLELRQTSEQTYQQYIIDRLSGWSVAASGGYELTRHGRDRREEPRLEERAHGSAPEAGFPKLPGWEHVNPWSVFLKGGATAFNFRRASRPGQSVE